MKVGTLPMVYVFLECKTTGGFTQTMPQDDKIVALKNIGSATKWRPERKTGLPISAGLAYSRDQLYFFTLSPD